MICTTPRSGSTLLCQMLAATNVAGRPDSHFHVPSLDRWLADYGLAETRFAARSDALRAVVAAAMTRGMGDTDIFGLRMQRGSFDYFLDQLARLVPGPMRDVDRIEAVLGPTVFIHLTRPDKLDQAISRVRAEQTGLWHRRADGSELERLSPPQAPRYAAAAIAQHMEALIALDQAWERWFEAASLSPLRIRYDALADQPQKVLAEVLAALELDPKHAQGVETPTAKLADAENRAWRARFEAER